MSEHYPQDNACYTCHGSREIECECCQGRGCPHCGNTGLIDCPTCQTDAPTVKEAMNTNCKNCDKPGCEAESMAAKFRVIDTANLSIAEVFGEGRKVSDALNACRANTVNWRDRCLAAEAELAKLREGLPKWHTFGNGNMVLSGAAVHGTVAPVLGYWRAFIDDDYECTVGRALTPESARRLVEQHHGLPVCEVLP